MISLLKIFTFFLLLSFESYSNDTLTIVAVGDAEKEVEIIKINSPKSSKLNVSEQKKVVRTVRIIKEDFKFYKHKYEIKSEVSDKDKVRYDIQLGIVSKKLKVKVVDNLNKNELLNLEVSIQFKNIRSFAHDISDNIYSSITGKKSIFKSKIIFVSDRTSRGKNLRKELYIMDFDGSRKQRLTFQNSIVIAPSLSMDNTKVLFTLVESAFKKNSVGKVQKLKNLNLYEMNLRTRKIKMISNIKGINSGAIYNKKGDSIYLTLSFQKNADIYKMNLKTRKISKITSHFSDDVDPHINSDESLMTMLSGRAGRAHIYTLDPRGVEKNVKRISFVGRFNAAPRFNAEGSEIVFSSWVDNRFDIYRVDNEGKNLARLTKNFGSNEEPWFSPDGEFIVFTSQRVISRKKAVQDVYIMNRDGEIIKKITENYGKISTPRWSN